MQFLLLCFKLNKNRKIWNCCDIFYKNKYFHSILLKFHAHTHVNRIFMKLVAIAFQQLNVCFFNTINLSTLSWQNCKFLLWNLKFLKTPRISAQNITTQREFDQKSSLHICFVLCTVYCRQPNLFFLLFNRFSPEPKNRDNSRLRLLIKLPLY